VHATCALQIVAQSNTFILAGYETTANTLSFCIYNIALDPEVQRRLLQEVDQFGRDRRVTYQDLDKVRGQTALHTPLQHWHVWLVSVAELTTHSNC
jgi:YD repeat-containing protein